MELLVCLRSVLLQRSIHRALAHPKYLSGLVLEHSMLDKLFRKLDTFRRQQELRPKVQTSQLTLFDTGHYFVPAFPLGSFSSLLFLASGFRSLSLKNPVFRT